MATTAGSAAQPKWMPGHLNRETRRLRLSRGGGAWESPFGPFIVSVFPSSSPPSSESLPFTPRLHASLTLNLNPIIADRSNRRHARVAIRVYQRATRRSHLLFFSFFSSSRRFHASRNLVDAVLKKKLRFFFFHFFFLYRVAHSRAIGYIWRGKLTGRNVPLLINL